MTISREEVVYAFQFILGRDPENERVIESHKLENIRALRAVLLKSVEFREKYNKDFPLPVESGK